MSLKQKQRPPAPDVMSEEPIPQVDVAHSPVRCPYCHDSCTAEDLDAIVCQKCLSRHHAGCWHEDRKCASCGSKRALAGARPEVEVAPKEIKLVRRGMSREAVLHLLRRTDASELEATRAMLQAASGELERRRTFFGLPIWAVIVLAMLAIPVLAILSS